MWGLFHVSERLSMPVANDYKSRPQDAIRGHRPLYLPSLAIQLSSQSTCYSVTPIYLFSCFYNGSSNLALRSMAMASQHLSEIALLFDAVSFQPRTTVLMILQPFSQHSAIVNETQTLSFKTQLTTLLK